jgi:hypothetical protein
MTKALRIVAHVWCYMLLAVMIASFAFTVYRHGVWYALDLFSPLSVPNFIVSIVLAAPALACLLLAEKIEGRTP